ncbi:MAG TPA: transglutaminase family protein [Stellaceae bacterium]|nr:transglutaminase family protein [Stellaceae bacterium]
MNVLTVRHVTTYRYKQPVSFGEHRMMLRPRDGHDQKLLEARLDISPEPAELRWVHDVFGNCVALARFSKRAEELRVDSFIRLDHEPSNALEFRLDAHAATYPFAYSSEEGPDLLRSIERQYLDPARAVDGWARGFLRRQGPTDTRELLAAMTQTVKDRFTYTEREETGIQDPIDTLRLGSGSCRDFAVLMIEAARSLGLAARFVSGYLYAPDGGGRVGGGYVGGGATHAWVQVYLPGAGWVEFDPTNGIVGNRDLIRVAVVRDARQAVPLSGSWTGFPSDFLGMSVEVSVTADGEDRQEAEAPPQSLSRA